MQPPTRPDRGRWTRHGLVIVSLVVVAVVGWALVAAAYGTWPFTRPCCPPVVACQVGSRACPLPPPPSPTVLIAAGTVDSIGPGAIMFFQFQLSPATFATVSGSFATTHGAVVAVMTPSDFDNFSAAQTTYRCEAADQCFSTGNVTSGQVAFGNLPIYRNSNGGTEIEPWFLVMQDYNTIAQTNITWVTNLTATYADVSA